MLEKIIYKFSKLGEKITVSTFLLSYIGFMLALIVWLMLIGGSVYYFVNLDFGNMVFSILLAILFLLLVSLTADVVKEEIEERKLNNKKN